MSKVITEVYDEVPIFAVDETGKALITEEQYSWLCNYAIRMAERVQELEEENRFQMSETHKNLDKVIYLDKEKERYKQALEQVEGFLVKANKFYVNNRDFAVNYNINEALEVIKELKGESE